MSTEPMQERQRCEQAWRLATQNRDRQALRNLRLHIIDATRRTRREPGAREEWRAWVLLRCVLLLQARRF